MDLAAHAREWKAEAVGWCAGRAWRLRAAVVLGLVYFAIWHTLDSRFRSPFAALDLGIHELGHVVFAPFGQFIGILGGSLAQALAPIATLVMFRRQGDWFAMAVALAWLGINGFEVATYVGDARAESLPLVSPFQGEEIIHDWSYLLEATGLLAWDTTLAGLLRLISGAAMLAAIAAGTWLCCQMAVRDGPAPPGLFGPKPPPGPPPPD